MGKAGLSDIWQTDAGAMHHYDTAVGILRHPHLHCQPREESGREHRCITHTSSNGSVNGRAHFVTTE